jgi:hypothetical protein
MVSFLWKDHERPTQSDQGSSWADFFSRSTAMTTPSIGKGRRLKSIMNIKENMSISFREWQL